MTKQTTIYVLDLVPGATVEEKAYQVIADGYEEYGYEDVDHNYPSLLTMVKDLFRITAATSIPPEQGTALTGAPAEWEVVVEGEDHNIEEYETILREME